MDETPVGSCGQRVYIASQIKTYEPFANLTNTHKPTRTGTHFVWEPCIRLSHVPPVVGNGCSSTELEARHSRHSSTPVGDKWQTNVTGHNTWSPRNLEIGWW